MRHLSQKRGFTLIELLVAVAIFSVVMTISVGALLSLADANRKAQSVKSVMNNLNFALESMARSMRVGYDYHCSPSPNPSANIESPKDCTQGGVLVAFEPYNGDPSTATDQVIYRLRDNQIERSEDGGASFIGVTAPEVRVDELQFYVTNTSSSDDKQPRVVITLRGTAGASTRTETTFAIQTTVTQRLLDL